MIKKVDQSFICSKISIDSIDSSSIKSKKIMNFLNYFKKILTEMHKPYKKRRFIIKKILLFFISTFNIIFIPLTLAFKNITYTKYPLILTIEILSLIFLIIRMNKKVSRFLSRNKVIPNTIIRQRKINQNKINLISQSIYIIPFALIFDITNSHDRTTNNLKISLQLIRMLYLKRFFYAFKIFKNLNLGALLKIMITYLLLCHTIACFFIILGMNESVYN